MSSPHLGRTARLFAITAVVLACESGGSDEAGYKGEYRGPYDGDYELRVDPRRALSDEPVRISLSGLRSGQAVTLRAAASDGSQTRWESRATFLADDDGRVDPGRQAPVDGTYVGVDPRGLLWSMRAIPPYDGGDPRFSTEGLEHATITFSAEAGGATLAQASTERVYPWQGKALRRESLDADGLVGTLWTPEGAERFPTIVVLGGSGGTPQPARSSLLAARDYTVLDLQYFGTDPLPSELIEIPVEYVGRALAWLRSHPAADVDRLGVFGASKGAELALLVATTEPSIRAVTAYLPSAVVWQGISFTSLEPRSSWSRDGEPVPFVPFGVSVGTVWKSIQLVLGRAVALRGTYELGLADADATTLREAAIPVERIRGAILLVSGADDQVGPSKEAGDQIVARLRQHAFANSYEHLAFEGAGHGLGLPYFPRSLSKVSSWSGEAGRLIHGGSAQTNERASAEGWAATLRFFARHLQPAAPAQVASNSGRSPG